MPSMVVVQGHDESELVKARQTILAVPTRPSFVSHLIRILDPPAGRLEKIRYGNVIVFTSYGIFTL